MPVNIYKYVSFEINSDIGFLITFSKKRHLKFKLVNSNELKFYVFTCMTKFSLKIVVFINLSICI